MTDDEREKLAELKTFAWAAPNILPLISKRKRITLDLLLSEFRQGKTDNLARIAELNAFYVLEAEIASKQNEYATLEKHHADTTNRK